MSKEPIEDAGTHESADHGALSHDGLSHEALADGALSHDALADLVPLYALDALDPEEAESVHAHLAECEQCREEYDQLLDTVADLSEITAAEPPPALRGQVLAAAARLEQEPAPEGESAPSEASEPSATTAKPAPSATSEPVATTAKPAPSGAAVPDGEEGPSRRPLLRRRTLVAGGLALAASAAIGTGLAVTQPWLSPEQKQVRHVLDASDARTYTASLDSATIQVTRSRSEGAVVLQADDLPAPPSGHDYQMWVLAGTADPVSAGLLRPGEDGSVRMLLDGSVASATGVAMTVEPEGGSEQPTTDPAMDVEFS